MKLFVFVLLAAAVAFAAPIVVKPGDAMLNQLKGLSQDEINNNVWAVLVAGSNGWSNYRHQSDLCHAYQVLHKAGVPDVHIITMMYDDIANSRSNPTKGVIINEPNGPNVYEGVPKDYTGADVNLKTFTDVLTGVAPTVGSKRALQSGPNDHVLVWFDDHGNTDIIAFPTGAYMYSKDLSATLNTMYKKQLYGKMVVYISACLSGSMFYKLTLPPNVYAATSAPIAASAFAINYDSYRGVYLCSGWPYAMTKFMETSTSNTDTFQDQFDFSTTHLLNFSQPCQYGQIDQSTLLDWFGGMGSQSALPAVFNDAIPEWDVPYETARRSHMAQNSQETFQAFQKEQTIRTAVDRLVEKVTVAAVGQKIMPCTTCDSSCPCVQECDDPNPALCKFECCDEKACTQDFKKADKEVAMRAQKADTCTKLTTRVIQSLCRKGDMDHHYIASAEAAMHRLCRQKNFDLEAAIREIKNQCQTVSDLL